MEKLITTFCLLLVVHFVYGQSSNVTINSNGDDLFKVHCDLIAILPETIRLKNHPEQSEDSSRKTQMHVSESAMLEELNPALNNGIEPLKDYG